MRPVRQDVPKIRKIKRDSFVSLKAPIDPQHAAAVWEVFVEGGEVVGPVSADQIARGMRAGKVPADASIRRANETFWSDLLDVPEIVSALKAVSQETELPPAPSPESGSSPGLRVRQFMVWVEGATPVGPVSADQIARGIRAGKVPADASLQRVGDLFAYDLLDEPDVIAALKSV